MNDNHVASKAVTERIHDHDPRLYETAQVATPVDGLSAITQEHLDFYAQEGYLAVANVLTQEQTRSASEALVALILGSSPDFKGIDYEPSVQKPESLPDAERQDAVRKLMGFVDFSPTLRELALLPALVETIERMLGEPARMVQDMALIKPPRIGREKPWHQDKAYFNLPTRKPVVGVWIALDEATIENGCMHVQPRGHHQGPIVHFARRDWQICDTDVMGKPCVAVPLPPGGAMLFDGLLPHGTPTNHSTLRRKALQFHYAGVSTESTSDEERMAIFGSEGRHVSC